MDVGSRAAWARAATGGLEGALELGGLSTEWLVTGRKVAHVTEADLLGAGTQTPRLQLS